jgi:hypothetical protein
VVPDWFQKNWVRIATGSSLAPRHRFLLAFFLLYFAYGFLHLTTLVDWVGYAVDEGFTSYGAERWREGQVPHRDFFFLWTPGILALHAALQELGFSAAGERAASLLASAVTGVLVLRWAWDWGLAAAERWLLAALLFVWGFTLWNVPYSSWFGLCFVALATLAAEKNRPYWAGLALVAAFWFKQNMGLLGGAGLLAGLFFLRPPGQAIRAGAALAAGIILPFGLALIGDSEFARKAFYQIFIFPFTYRRLMAEPLPLAILAAPLASLGVWIISLYFFRASPRVKFFSQLAVVVYASMGILREGLNFYLGGIYLLSLAAWAVSPLAIIQIPREKRGRILLVWLPLAGAFLQVYPRWDFQHFLFVFPAAALFVVWFLSWIRSRYQFSPAIWVQLPAIFLLIGGLVNQVKINTFYFYGKIDPVGFISFGSGNQLNAEMAEVRDYLLARGLLPGGQVLVMPNATSFYRFSGFRNPTPHDQFFPGYVEAFGAREEEVLNNFELGGGEFVVVQKRSRLQDFAPEMERNLREKYQVAQDFPVHFSVWKRKPGE